MSTPAFDATELGETLPLPSHNEVFALVGELDPDGTVRTHLRPVVGWRPDAQHRGEVPLLAGPALRDDQAALLYLPRLPEADRCVDPESGWHGTRPAAERWLAERLGARGVRR